MPIYYESRIAKLGLNAAALPKLDAEFDEITEGEEQTSREKLKTKWAAIEALDGKAMIVCMSRRICVDLYNALIKLRPEWASAKDDDIESEKGKDCVVKVVMTGSADDGPDWQPHIRNKDKRRKLANRFKDSKDSFRIVIVRDMWLTGFDAPCLHTMYADKPMRGHGLMQAIARVNRVFRDKPGGLVVDYLGLADQLKHALATYTDRVFSPRIAARATFALKAAEWLRRGRLLMFAPVSTGHIMPQSGCDPTYPTVQISGASSRAIVTQVRKSVSIDWTLRESARAKIRVMVKRILNKYGYPPDLQEEAVKTVLMQAELLCGGESAKSG